MHKAMDVLVKTFSRFSETLVKDKAAANRDVSMQQAHRSLDFITAATLDLEEFARALKPPSVPDGRAPLGAPAPISAIAGIEGASAAGPMIAAMRVEAAVAKRGLFEAHAIIERQTQAVATLEAERRERHMSCAAAVSDGTPSSPRSSAAALAVVNVAELEATVCDLQAQLKRERKRVGDSGERAAELASARHSASQARREMNEMRGELAYGQSALLAAREEAARARDDALAARRLMADSDVRLREQLDQVAELEEARRAWRQELAEDKERLHNLQQACAKHALEKARMDAAVADVQANAQRRANEALAAWEMSRDAAVAMAARPSVELLRENERLRREVAELQRETRRRADEAVAAMAARNEERRAGERRQQREIR